MSLQMVHSNERDVARVPDSFCKSAPYQQRTNQSRTAAYGNGIDCVKGNICRTECFIDNRPYHFEMTARCQFGNNPSILIVDIRLRRNNRRKYLLTA